MPTCNRQVANEEAAVPVIPTVFDQTPRGERALDVYSRLLRSRVVLLDVPVDDQSASLLVAQLLHLATEDDTQDISLYVNSPGGSVTSMFAIYDTMQLVPCDVATYCLGLAASAAAVIVAAGAPDKRFILPNSRILIHQPHGGAQGQSIDIELQAAEIRFMRERMQEMLALHTGQSIERIARDTDRDYILGAEAAVEYGLVDQVIVPERLRLWKGSHRLAALPS
jgi:ATP-dependent Clp protease protease subunit